VHLWYFNTTCRLCIVHQGVHYQRIISNTVLQLSHSLFSKLNELERGRPTRVLVLILYYRGHGLSFSSHFQIFSCFVLSGFLVYHLQASNQLLRSSAQGNRDGSLVLIAVTWIFWDWHMRALINEVVNLMDITYLWLAVVCAWLWECLSMNVSNHCSQCFMSVSMLFLELCLSRWR